MKPTDRLFSQSWKIVSRGNSGMPSNMARIFKLIFKNKFKFYKGFKIFSQIKKLQTLWFNKAAYFLEIINSNFTCILLLKILFYWEKWVYHFKGQQWHSKFCVSENCFAYSWWRQMSFNQILNRKWSVGKLSQ